VYHFYDDGSEQVPLPGMPAAGPPSEPPPAEEPSPAVMDQARAALQRQLDELMAANKNKNAELMRHGAQVAPHVVLMTQLEQLLEMVLSEDARLGFDLGFHGRMGQVLSDCLAEVRQASLLGSRSGPASNGHPGHAAGHAAGPAPGLILPG
jgi:hypothetical protein